MAVTDLDVSALVHLAYRIREDTHGITPWDRQGTHVVFTRELKGMHLPTAVEIVIRHASDPDAKTPAAITRPFLPAAPSPATAREPEPTPAERCSTCSNPRERCRQIWGRDHPFVSVVEYARLRAARPTTEETP